MTQKWKPNLSVVIPVYNSAGCLDLLVQALGEELPVVAHNFEVILVNDGSMDASWNVICALQRKYSWLRGINLMRNYGQHNALLCGIREAQYEITLTMDDDQQHPPAEIKTLVNKLVEEDIDVVYGRPARQEHGLFRDTASALTKLVIKQALGNAAAPDVSAFRAFKTKIRRSFENYSSPSVNLDVLLTWGSNKFGMVLVQHRPRSYQTSNYTFGKLITHAVNMLTGFSTLPLQIASLNGLALVGLGVVLLAYVFGRYMLWGVVVPGFAFLASIIIIFSGAQLLALGIIGEYVGRIYTRTMDRPSYQVDETDVNELLSGQVEETSNLKDYLRV